MDAHCKVYCYVGVTPSVLLFVAFESCLFDCMHAQAAS